jgi:hypothetical protein
MRGTIIKFMSVNIRQFALKALETARKDLARDKYLVPVAFIVTEDGIRDFTLDFGDNEQKMLAYSKLVEIAKQDKATAIITVNDANISKGEQNSAATNKQDLQECIFLTVSGPLFSPWSVCLPYDRLGTRIVFGQPDETSGDFLNLLPGWSEFPRKMA